MKIVQAILFGLFVITLVGAFTAGVTGVVLMARGAAGDAVVVGDPAEPLPAPGPEDLVVEESGTLTEPSVVFRMQILVELMGDGSVRPADPPPALSLRVEPDWTWTMTRE